MRILPTSAAIRGAVGDLMSPGPRRVAIAAFVGEGARTFIRNPKGVELICWPKAGGTNPLELRKLKRAGARIRFVDRLHMKLYWAAGRGAIITSANLSTNALGAGDLKEFGVLLPANSLRIDAVIASLRTRPFNAVDMRKLELEHRKLKARMRRSGEGTDRVSFREWYELPARSEWKLGWWDSKGGFSKNARQHARGEFNAGAAYNFISCRAKEYCVGDWALSFRLSNKGASGLEWLYVDFAVKVSRADKAYFNDYPFQAVQVSTPKYYPAPPFAIGSDFRMAFSKAVVDFGIDRVRGLRSARVPNALLELVVKRIT